MDVLKKTAGYLKFAVIALALWFLLIYIVLACFHIRFPFALEWIEGSMLDHVKRVLAGKLVYVPPSIEFVPAIYPPLFFYVSALVSKITGFGFMPLRLVSFVSSIAIFVLIFFIVIRETGSKFSAIVAAGLFAATYRLSGPYLDMGRVDSLFLFLFFAALYTVKFKDSLRSALFAGILISFSVLTKQTAIVLSGSLILYCALFHSRLYTCFFIISMAVFTGFSCLLINYAHEGWFKFYVFDLPGQHPVSLNRLADFWAKDIFLSLPFACAFCLLYFIRPVSAACRKNMLFYLLVSVSIIAVSCMSRLKSGGGKNVLIPSYAVISVLFGLAVGSGLRLAKNFHMRKKTFAEILICLLCLLQFTTLIYNPLPMLPDKRFLRQYNSVVKKIAQTQGDVFAPSYGYLCVMAGKNGSAHIGAINDILRGSEGPARDLFIHGIREAIQEKRFSAIILDRKLAWFQKDIERYYVQQKGFNRQDPCWPLIRYFYIPRSK